MDTAAPGACAACDSVRGERRPQPARNRGSNPRQRRGRALTRRSRGREDALGRRDRRRSDSWLIQSSSIRLSPIRWSSVRSLWASHEECQEPEPGQAQMQRSQKAQLCFACRPRAKVSSFPLADRLAERTRACRSPANDHLLSNLYHGRSALSSPSCSRDSNQPDAAPHCHDRFCSSDDSFRGRPGGNAPRRQHGGGGR